MNAQAERVGALVMQPAGWLAVKLVALAMMVFDHADQAVYGLATGFHETWGRAVFPLFALVLGRSVFLAEPLHLLRVVVPRMVLFGALALPFYVPLFGLAPLNVMFSLAVAVAMVAFWRMGWVLAAGSLFVVGGALVDYQWFGLLCVALAAWAMAQDGAGDRWRAAAVLAVMAVLLVPINGNLWALAAIPLVLFSSFLTGPAPRLKWLFYAAYPGHLLVLAIAESLLNGT